MTTDETVTRLTRWATGRDDVRAMILTSTRAIPNAEVDAYSDYDVIVVVDEVQSMVDEAGWLADFGEVLITYWDPVRVNPATGAVSVGSITYYVDGLKIDFSLWSRQQLSDVIAGTNDEFDAGYRVLVDKEFLVVGLPLPTYRGYVPARPDEPTYVRLITDFLIGVPYVAKYLLRGELLPAKWVLDFDMRFNYLVPMLWWRVECDHAWTLKSGNLGRGLLQHLPEAVAAEFERTFTGADSESNWAALFAMITLFRHVAGEVAELLGYRFPDQLIDSVTEHARRMRRGDFADGQPA